MNNVNCEDRIYLKYNQVMEYVYNNIDYDNALNVMELIDSLQNGWIEHQKNEYSTFNNKINNMYICLKN